MPHFDEDIKETYLALLRVALEENGDPAVAAEQVVKAAEPGVITPAASTLMRWGADAELWVVKRKEANKPQEQPKNAHSNRYTQAQRNAFVGLIKDSMSQGVSVHQAISAVASLEGAPTKFSLRAWAHKAGILNDVESSAPLSASDRLMVAQIFGDSVVDELPATSVERFADLTTPGVAALIQEATAERDRQIDDLLRYVSRLTRENAQLHTLYLTTHDMKFRSDGI